MGYHKGLTEPQAAALDAYLGKQTTGNRDTLLRLLMPLIESVANELQRFGEQDDLSQELAIAVLEALPTYDPKKSPFRNFLFFIMKRRASSYGRYSSLDFTFAKSNRHTDERPKVVSADFMGEPGTAPSDTLETLDFNAVFLGQLSATLSFTEKAVLSLICKGTPLAAIAKKLRLTRKAADNARTRIITKGRRLRKGNDSFLAN